MVSSRKNSTQCLILKDQRWGNIMGSLYQAMWLRRQNQDRKIMIICFDIFIYLENYLIIIFHFETTFQDLRWFAGNSSGCFHQLVSTRFLILQNDSIILLRHLFSLAFGLYRMEEKNISFLICNFFYYSIWKNSKLLNQVIE